MKGKEIFLTIIITVTIMALCAVSFLYDQKIAGQAEKAYLVYLNGETIGLIKDEEELYNIINKEQNQIKNEYGVKNVYPPTGFNLVKVNTYNDQFTPAQNIYQKVAEVDDFTIKGYIITIKFPKEENEDPKPDLVINVLDKSIFEAAMRKFILAFVSEEELDTYLNNETEELTDIGQIINKMYFNETITIKEGYISVKDKIYKDVDSLSQFLLFGPDAVMDSYTVALGDSIESISEEHHLNPQEFIVANPKYRETNALLEVGEKVNVTLLDPVISYVYEVNKIEEQVDKFSKTEVVDSTKDASYSKITTPGVSGIKLVYETYQVKNGEALPASIDQNRTITVRERVDQVTTIGKPSYGRPVNTNGEWGWPTNSPYVITSEFAWRWGSHHDAIDISGPGKDSPIYAAKDGVVVEAEVACKGCSRWKEGTFVVIQHENNMYTLYAHMNSLKVKVGDVVSRGQQIGGMGETGYAFGVHLHFSICTGWPYHGSYTFHNPRNYY